MGRKRNPYLPLYTRDIMSSPRCRALSCQATGVYLWLLCRLNEPPTPGAFRLSDWEAHPTWKRSLTQQCLAEPDKQRRLQYFARYLAKNDLPWDRKEVLDGLQELYRMGIVVVEGDMLVQPRMYKDNGFELPDLDQDGDPEGTILEDAASGSMAVKDDEELSENNGAENGTEKGTQKRTKKVQEKAPVSHARASRALSVENMSNNNIEEGNIGGAGDLESVKKKTGEKHPTGRNMASDGEKNDGAIDLSSNEEKRTSEPENMVKNNSNAASTRKRKQTVADNPPTLEEVQAYFDERAQQGRPFIYVTPEGFYDACCQSGWTLKDGKPMIDWRARVRTFENFRKEHGDKPAVQGKGPSRAVKPGEAVPQKSGKDYDAW